MLRYIARRLLVALPTLLLVSIFVFLLQKLLPGDPILALAGRSVMRRRSTSCGSSII